MTPVDGRPEAKLLKRDGEVFRILKELMPKGGMAVLVGVGVSTIWSSSRGKM